MTIIERDVNFYEDQLEEERRRLRQCAVDDEDALKYRIECCEAVIAALKEYAVALPDYSLSADQVMSSPSP